MTESRKSVSNIPAIPNTVTDSVHENSQENVSPDPVQSTLPRLDLPQAAFNSEDREETLCTDETALETPETNGQNTPWCMSCRLMFWFEVKFVQVPWEMSYTFKATGIL